MLFLETPIFTRAVTRLLSDYEYLKLQGALVGRPTLGVVIPRTGGVRKARWGQEGRGKGKRGGVRVIYFWYERRSTFYMLAVFSKDEQEDLTRNQERILRQLVEDEFS